MKNQKTHLSYRDIRLRILYVLRIAITSLSVLSFVFGIIHVALYAASNPQDITGNSSRVIVTALVLVVILGVHGLWKIARLIIAQRFPDYGLTLTSYADSDCTKDFASRASTVIIYCIAIMITRHCAMTYDAASGLMDLIGAAESLFSTVIAAFILTFVAAIAYALVDCVISFVAECRPANQNKS